MEQIDPSLYLLKYCPVDDLDLRIQFNICASSIQERYLSEPDPSLIFSRCIFYLDLYEKIAVDSNFIQSEYMQSMDFELISLTFKKSHQIPKKDLTGSTFSVTPFKILNRSGTIIDRICDKVSHIIIPKNASLELVQAINKLVNFSQGSYSKRPYVVSQEWIDECLRKCTLEDELAFKPYQIIANT